jgi:hypothetical protein
MNGSPDINDSAPADEGDMLDVRQAADILDRPTRRARRQFDADPPLLGLLRAVIALVAYGTVWLSVRGQHRYDGLRTWLIVLLAVLARSAIALSIGFVRHATKGVSGRPARPWWAEICAVVVALAAVFVFMGALDQAGAGHAVVYGVYLAVAPLIIVGGTVAGFLAARADWPAFAAALAVVCVGAGGAFAGPAGAWEIAGLGLCLALLGHTAASAWLRWAKAVR